MTVTNDQTVFQYVGDDVTTAFPFSNVLFLDTDIVVILTDENSVSTLQVLNVDYTVAILPDFSAATVNMVVPPATGTPNDELLTIARNQPFIQLLDYVVGGAFPAQSHEQGLDKLTLQTQTLAQEVARSFRLDFAASQDDVDLIIPVPVALGLWRWNAAGDAVEYALAEDLVLTSSTLVFDGPMNWRNEADDAQSPFLKRTNDTFADSFLVGNAAHVLHLTGSTVQVPGSMIASSAVVNGVTLTAAGASDDFLSADGAYRPGGATTATWGGITGNINDQTDLGTLAQADANAVPAMTLAGSIDCAGNDIFDGGTITAGGFFRAVNPLQAEIHLDNAGVREFRIASVGDTFRIIDHTALADRFVIDAGGELTIFGPIDLDGNDLFNAAGITATGFIRVANAGSAEVRLDNSGTREFRLASTADSFVIFDVSAAATRLSITSGGQLDVFGPLNTNGSDIAGVANFTASGATITLSGLPVANPGGAGRLWNDAGTVKIT